jgi:hypothetical protein
MIAKSIGPITYPRIEHQWIARCTCPGDGPAQGGMGWPNHGYTRGGWAGPITGIPGGDGPQRVEVLLLYLLHLLHLLLLLHLLPLC